jgi:hypothetical protein
MKTKRALLAGIAGLCATAAVALAGPDTWRQPPPPKPKAPCCAVCLPNGACCDVKHRYGPGPAGRGITRTTTVLCNDACKMPDKERACCASGCVR